MHAHEEPEALLAEYAPIIRYIIPEDHTENQAYWAFLAQSKWFTFLESGSKRASAPDAVLMLFKLINKLNCVTNAGWKSWAGNTNSRWSCGKDEALSQTAKWIKAM